MISSNQSTKEKHIMNYIKQLEQERAELQDTIAVMQDRIQELRSYLLSDKFAPIQSDGSRGDLVATSDVLNHLRRIQFTDLP